MFISRPQVLKTRHFSSATPVGPTEFRVSDTGEFSPNLSNTVHSVGTLLGCTSRRTFTSWRVLRSTGWAFALLAAILIEPSAIDIRDFRADVEEDCSVFECYGISCAEQLQTLRRGRIVYETSVAFARLTRLDVSEVWEKVVSDTLRQQFRALKRSVSTLRVCCNGKSGASFSLFVVNVVFTFLVSLVLQPYSAQGRLILEVSR